MTELDCPRFERCSAPICPLDADWRKRRHVQGERVCGLALEAVKPNAKAVFSGAGMDNLFPVVVGAIPEISQRWGAIRHALERAQQAASKMAHGQAQAQRLNHRPDAAKADDHLLKIEQTVAWSPPAIQSEKSPYRQWRALAHDRYSSSRIAPAPVPAPHLRVEPFS